MNPCNHSHTVNETTGSVSFVAGEIVDTTTDRVFCLDCFEVVEVVPEVIEIDEIVPEF